MTNIKNLFKQALMVATELKGKNNIDIKLDISELYSRNIIFIKYYGLIKHLEDYNYDNIIIVRDNCDIQLENLYSSDEKMISYFKDYNELRDYAKFNKICMNKPEDIYNIIKELIF